MINKIEFCLEAIRSLIMIQVWDQLNLRWIFEPPQKGAEKKTELFQLKTRVSSVCKVDGKCGESRSILKAWGMTSQHLQVSLATGGSKGPTSRKFNMETKRNGWFGKHGVIFRKKRHLSCCRMV